MSERRTQAPPGVPLSRDVKREIEHNEWLASAFDLIGAPVLAHASRARAEYLRNGGDPAGPHAVIRTSEETSDA